MPTVEEIVARIPEAFNADAASDIDATVQYNASTPFYLVIKDGTCAVETGSADAPDLTLETDDEADMIAMMTGELDGVSAFMTGKLRMDGDLMLAQRLLAAFDYSKIS